MDNIQISEFDFKNPDYIAIFEQRKKRLAHIRANPHIIPSLKQFYRTNIAQFIIDWGATYDPRNPERGLPSAIPFILFPKQIEWIDWVQERWRSQEPGLVEKTRTVGMSWLSVAFACSLCLFTDGITIGFGSRKQEYIDLRGALKALLPKARMFLSLIPKEFLNGFDLNNDAPFMRINFKATGSQIIGESGDGIGRGDRASLYFVDEAAFLERPQLTEASLSETTNCRIDISTPNGLGNPFEIKRHSGKIKVFTFHWRDDPRRDEEWYAKKCAELDPVTVAQELDINYAASVEGVVIPSAWVQSAVNSHIKLKINPGGLKKIAWDVADTGDDNNAVCARDGILITYVEDWSGINGDTLDSTYKVFKICDELGYSQVDYDADGLGAGVRSDARTANENRKNGTEINITPFHGSGAVINPEAKISNDRTNAEFFVNLKAQSWWHLRILFMNTHRAIVEGLEYDPDEIISIPNNSKLMGELSQPTYSAKTNGKLIINKKPSGTKSPNMADSVMMAFAPTVPTINWSDPAFMQEIITPSNIGFDEFGNYGY